MASRFKYFIYLLSIILTNKFHMEKISIGSLCSLMLSLIFYLSNRNTEDTGKVLGKSYLHSSDLYNSYHERVLSPNYYSYDYDRIKLKSCSDDYYSLVQSSKVIDYFNAIKINGKFKANVVPPQKIALNDTLKSCNPTLSFDSLKCLDSCVVPFE